jgi:hypothetical protein
MLCLFVTYVSGSIATGCHIELQCPNEPLITYNITETDGCINTTGVNGVKTCTLKGYDIVNNDIEYSGPAVIIDDVTISGLIRPTGTMTSPSVSVSSTNPTAVAFNVSLIIVTVVSSALVLLTIIALVTLLLLFITRKKSEPQNTTSTNKVIPVTYKLDTCNSLIDVDKDNVRPASSTSAVSYGQISESESRISASSISLRQRTQVDRDVFIKSSVSLPLNTSRQNYDTLNEQSYATLPNYIPPADPP